ncbi:MAG: thioredoxin family protein [Clostridiales bacterium]|nr:thioredoxin family protein [Clostridiales bacterium]MBT9259917.1 thioredoxin family protein [Clostridiales bacterium]
MTERILDDETRQKVMEILEDMDAPVEMVLVDEPLEMGEAVGGMLRLRQDLDQLLKEMTEITDKISVRRLTPEEARAEGLEADYTPALYLRRQGEDRKNVVFVGAPSGFEFGTLVEDIVDISKGQTHLSPQTKEFLSQLKEELLVQVFVTPTCPYCPRMVRLAHQMAMESDLVKAQMVDATQFPELASLYHVHAVPRTVVNRTLAIEGAVPEPVFINRVKSAVL